MGWLRFRGEARLVEGGSDKQGILVLIPSAVMTMVSDRIVNFCVVLNHLAIKTNVP